MRPLAIAAGIILGLGTVSSGFGQALAEGALVHANSAAGTAKAGSALGNALSRAMSGNAEKMESLSAGKIEHVPHASGKPARSSGSAQSSGPLVIMSVRGANQPCIAAITPQPASKASEPAPTTKADAAKQAKTATQLTPAAQDCGTPTAPQRPSKSVVNLAFPK